jgi:hypothetical protein
MEKELEEYYLANPTERPQATRLNIPALNASIKDDLKQLNKKEKNIKEHLKSKGYTKKTFKKTVAKLESLSGLDPIVKKYDKIRYGRANLIEFKFQNYGKLQTKEKIQQITNDFSKYMKESKINGRIANAIFYTDMAWKSSKLSDMGDDVLMYDSTYNGAKEYTDPNGFSKFVIYALIDSKTERHGRIPQAVMGNGNNNNCLWECLNFALLHRNPWKTPESLKRFLLVRNNDKIPLTLIPKIEEKLKSFGINITGDYEYKTTIKSNKIINLVLKDEHIKLDYSVDNKKVSNIRYNEKIIMLFDKMTFMGYDGISERLLTIPEKRDIIYNVNSKYILIDRVGITNKARQSGEFQTLKEEYEELIENANYLKKETNGIINFYKTGSIKNTALGLFDRMTKFIMNPEKIDEEEIPWIKGASGGALTYCDKGYEGKLYKYDYVSMYPHILTTVAMMPIKKGEFLTLKSDEFDVMKKSFFKFGIYRAIVTSDTSDNSKLFKFNKKNYYTQTSLTDAITLGLNIELIEDDEPNFLYYSSDKLIQFQEIFKEYINFLFPLKVKKVKYSKNLLNILWGALGEINKKKFYVQDNQIDIPTNQEIYSLRPSNTNGDDLLIKTTQTNNYYKLGFARLTPFIISKGRQMMMKTLKDKAQHIHHIQTDGFLSDIKLDFKTGDGLGDLRYEGCCNDTFINHLNDVQGEFVL